MSHVNALQTVLADTYALSLKAQNYHWNVEGRHFQSLHAVFEAQYTELAAAIDVIAERIRTFGVRIDANFASFAQRKTVTDARADLDENAMVADLLEGHRSVIASLKNALVLADEVGDAYTSGFITERIGAHEKAGWMLRSMLKDEMRDKHAPAAEYEGGKKSVKKFA